jgi:NADH-quinone oxidoreductase subunit A
MQEYIGAFIMITIGIALGLLLNNLQSILVRKRSTVKKLMPYESGMDPVGTARDRFSIKFYMTAMLFILFDIEIIFMYPWAVQYKELGAIAFVEMFTFVAILFVGYIYVVKKGGLDWN